MKGRILLGGLFNLLLVATACAQLRLYPSNAWNQDLGDSWVRNNQLIISRSPGPNSAACSDVPCLAIFGIARPEDGWDERLRVLTSLPYTNRGHGGAASGTIYNEAAAAIAQTSLIQYNNWLDLSGRNDVTNPGGENWPAIADGTYSINVTATFTNGSSAITGISPSLATTPGGSISGWTVSGTAGLPTGANVAGSGTTATLAGWSGGQNVASNFTGTTGAKAVTLTAAGATQFLTLIPHNRKLLLMPYGGATIGLADGVRWQRLKWLYRRTHRQYLFELPYCWMGVYPFGALQDGSEDQTVAQQGMAPSVSINAHPNYNASPLIAGCLAEPTKAMANRAVHALRATIPDIPYDIAAAGVMGQLYGYGNITSWSKVSDDCSGCVDVNSSGQVVRTASGSFQSVVHIVARATGLDYTGGAVTSDAAIRLLPSIRGSAAPTTPLGATFTLDNNAYANKMWPRMHTSVTPFANSGKLTFIVCLKPALALDSVNMNFFVSGTTILFNRGPTNKWVVSLRDSATNVVLSSWTSVTTNYTNTNGYQWFFFSIDITGAGVISAYSVNASGTAANIAPATAPTVGSGLLNLSTSTFPSFFAPSSGGSASFGGSVKLIYVAANTFFDWSNAANLALFESAGQPISLGTNCATPSGAQPEICMMGAAGDWPTGYNQGSSGDWGYNDTYGLGFSNSSDPTAP